VQQVSAVSAVSTSDKTAAAKVDGLVDSMEQYAATLGNPSASLKDAYGQLEQLSRDVQQVREQLPDLGQNAPDLDAVVNEVEALAATEQFKFNRGDYV
jgi:ABC-type transporter Mla subunit MlaD